MRTGLFATSPLTAFYFTVAFLQKVTPMGLSLTQNSQVFSMKNKGLKIF